MNNRTLNSWWNRDICEGEKVEADMPPTPTNGQLLDAIATGVLFDEDGHLGEWKLLCHRQARLGVYEYTLFARGKPNPGTNGKGHTYNIVATIDFAVLSRNSTRTW